MSTANTQHSDDDITRLAGLITEQFEDQLAKMVEAIDGRIEANISPLRESLESLEASNAVIGLAVKESSRAIQQLDKAIGNDEHEIHTVRALASDHYLSPREIRTLFKNLDTRVTSLETAL